MVLTYMLAFTRITLGIVFALSYFTKATNVQQFAQTIAKFNILPASLSKIVAILFLCGEGIVLLLMGVGGAYLTFGFALAFILLLLFSVAIISVLVRRIQTACNCFGSTEKPISIYDVGRNVSFILCALVGLNVAVILNGNILTLSFGELIIMSAQAFIFVLIMTYLDEFAVLFQQR